MLFIARALFTPWAQLVEGFSPFNLLPVAAAVGGMVLAGAALARPLGLAAADGAVLALTRAAMGGTGAIRRSQRKPPAPADLPQAQILTRIGGALTLAVAMAAIGVSNPEINFRVPRENSLSGATHFFTRPGSTSLNAPSRDL